MNILVTGSTGFLGRFLAVKLKEQGHKLVLLNSRKCDLTVQGALNKFNNIAYDEIYHLAAWTQAGDFCLHHPGEQWIVNQLINTNVLAWWKDYQPQAKMLAVGSSCAYDPSLSLTEENYLRGTPIESLFAYAMTKRMLYAGLIALHKQFNLQYLYLVPSTLYGPDYHLDGRQMHFIFDIIRKIMEGKLYGRPVVLWGDGYQKRELVYVEDFVSIMLELSKIHKNDIVNIGSGREYSIRHFARLLCKKIGYDFKSIQFDKNRYTGARSKCLVIDKLKALIPDLKMTPLDGGLQKTVDWFRKEKEVLFSGGKDNK